MNQTETPNRNTLPKSSSNKNLLDLVIQKLTPNKKPEDQTTASLNQSNNSIRPSNVQSQAPPTTPQKQQQQQQQQSFQSPNGAMDKTLYFSSIDASVVIGKDINSNYLNTIEPQLHVLNKKATLTNKEKPKKLNFQRESSFQNKFVDQHDSGLSSDSISPSVSVEDLKCDISGSCNQIPPPPPPPPQQHQQQSYSPQPNLPTLKPDTQQPIQSPPPPPPPLPPHTIDKPKTSQQTQHQSHLPPTKSQLTPLQTNDPHDDPNPLPFNLSEIPIAGRLYLDHLRTENDELKRQLNIVLADNAEQRENTYHLQGMIKELEEYTDQQDGWVSELRHELITSTELLLNHHQKIDALSEILTGCDEQKDQFHSLYSQSQELLQKTEEDNSILNTELVYLRDLTNQLDRHIVELNKEIKTSQEYKLDNIVQRLLSGVEPSGIEKVKSFQEKDLLLQEAIKIYNSRLQDDVLLPVIRFLRSTLHWKVFIQLLRNQRESLDYYIKYCKLTKNYDDLKLIYRDTHNTLEEGFVILKQSMEERDELQRINMLEQAVQFFERYPHLCFYKDTIVQFLNSKKNGVTMSTNDFNNKFIQYQQQQFINKKL
ncbi:hypothetical protein DLAC_05497 [Tieghemostelium lacteum]|uniref:Uncharacterized protein n=1 Tax=Tieghemostelium lacteum TaxID=361077 RepID=A0A151ZG05_TIELA|nr:hypothetical protein DLAC_05497 [Tieghemostelium lacteum]|eukprot:KYQ92906.1 hypothetical protein DLAC_05497 [Tieghemostelium lacteum]